MFSNINQIREDQQQQKYSFIFILDTCNANPNHKTNTDYKTKLYIYLSMTKFAFVRFFNAVTTAAEVSVIYYLPWIFLLHQKVSL